MAANAVTDATFDQDVLKADKPVLVDFWADWCPPCKMIAPVVEEIADEYADKLIVAKLDTQNNREIPARYKITAIPTLIIFKDGEEVERMVGFRGKDALKASIDGAL